MATYAIGDVQGCFDALMALLALIQFDPKQDKLWFTGDLVNRGPHSLQTLRYVHALGDRATTVLGNHDLHLLAVYHGFAPLKKGDHLEELIKAEDAPELCSWLQNQALLHYDESLNCLMVHAGLHPFWDLNTAKQYAKEMETVLHAQDSLEFFANMYGDLPQAWSDNLQGWPRYRFITNVFTRMRFLDKEANLYLAFKGEPEKVFEQYCPWFLYPNRKNAHLDIIFGHWAALQCKTFNTAHIFPLDSGCVWGNSLTALRLEDKKRFSVPCA